MHYFWGRAAAAAAVPRPLVAHGYISRRVLLHAVESGWCDLGRNYCPRAFVLAVVRLAADVLLCGKGF